MVFQSQLFRRITIVGVGLIGGSLGMAIKKHNVAREVIGVSQRNSSLVYAVKNKAIDRASHDLKRSVQNADLVILATPVGAIIELLSKIGPYVRRNCIITDVGSTKATIVDAANKFLPSPSFFVGSHPLAGSDKKGATYSSAELFENTSCIMTPTDKTNRLARDKVKQFWAKIGTSVKMLSPEDHDQVLAYTSHLPHLLAYSLVESVPKDYMQYAAQGFKDSTRIALSSPQMWNDISIANSKHILKSMDEFVKNIALLRKSIIARNEKEIVDYLSRSKEKRDSVDSND